MTDVRDELALHIERRRYHNVRAVFDAACERVRPFFDRSTAWNGQAQEYLALRTLRENYPELSGEEIEVLLVASRRALLGRSR